LNISAGIHGVGMVATGAAPARYKMALLQKIAA